MIIWLVSTESAAGKTAIAAGLGKRLAGEGKKVGYLKPRMAGDIEADAAAMKQLLGLPEAVEALSPPIAENASPDSVKEAFARASAGKDVLITEATLGAASQEKFYQLAKALGAKVIGIALYSGKPLSFDAYKGFGSDLLGIIVNKVPQSRLARVKAEVPSGAKILGIVPEDRSLMALTIAELAAGIGGKLLSGEKKADDLIEALMVGALSVDSGLNYFGRKANKAAVIRVDRPDMQLAALETSTRCLVLSGKDTPVFYRVTDKAASKNVPIIQAESDMPTVLGRIENALVKGRFNQPAKLPRVTEILQQSVDFKVLYGGLGLAT